MSKIKKKQNLFKTNYRDEISIWRVVKLGQLVMSRQYILVTLVGLHKKILNFHIFIKN